MIIHRSRPASAYTVIPDETLRDPRLSYETRGVLCELLSRPDDWHTTVDELAATARRQRGQAGEGRRKISAVFAQLRAAGYMVQQRERGPGGRMTTVTHVYDRPQTDSTTGGTPVRPAETRKIPGDTGLPGGWYPGKASPGGRPVRPAQTPVSAGRTEVPLTGGPVGGTSIRSTEDEVPTDEIPLSRAPRGPRAALAAVVPDVTERETELVLEVIRGRSLVQSASAVLRREIADGNGPALVAAVRQPPTAAPGSAPTLTPARYAEMCTWCSRPGHDRGACPERAELARDPGTEPRPLDKAASAEETGDGREEFARKLAAMKARNAERARVPAGPVYPDESRDVLPDDYGDGDHAA